MGTKLELAKSHIDKLISFLSIYMKLSQGHMVDYFTHNLYQNCIANDIKNEISCNGFDATVQILLSSNNEDLLREHSNNAKYLLKFIKESMSYSLYNLKHICMTRKEFFDYCNFENEDALKLEVFMKEKKSHEVEILSILAKNVANKANTSHLVDIGDGKGYLSSLIAFHHKLPILGVDGSLVNTESSIKRANRLEKRWEHLTARRKSNDEASIEAKRNKRTSIEYNDRIFLYKQVTKLVTEETDFDDLIKSVFLQSPTGIGLVGLHTCGNLGPTSIRIFNSSPNIKTIINVSCCYHLVNENYLANQAMGCIMEQRQGFPMSSYIRSKNFQLPRATRMLSAHSLDRILHNQELPSKIVFYRALLEIILDEMHFSGKHVGKFRKQPGTFTEYVRIAAVKLGITIERNDDDLEAIFLQYEERRKELDAYYLIRSMLSPAIEALILLDRFMFLLEQNRENVYLVQLFDPVISPRCYGLVCIK